MYVLLTLKKDYIKMLYLLIIKFKIEEQLFQFNYFTHQTIRQKKNDLKLLVKLSYPIT